MSSNESAIPTVYAGVQFRSRLEAKWAAFFDLLKWKWEYEPLDLNGYIPDFLLCFDTPMIVEVKPLVGSPFDWHHNLQAIEALEKVVGSGWEGEGLLVGATLFSGPHSMGWTEDDGPDPINAGLLFQARAETAEVYAEPFGVKACCGGPVDVVGYFQCRKCGHHDKGPTLRSNERVLGMWREAGNVVQWKSPTRSQSNHVHRRPEPGANDLVPADEVRAFFRSLSAEMGEP